MDGPEVDWKHVSSLGICAAFARDWHCDGKQKYPPHQMNLNLRITNHIYVLTLTCVEHSGLASSELI